MKRYWIPLGLILLLSCLLALVFQGFLREAVVVPILYAYWFVRLYIESLPQSLLWAIFIGAAVVVVGKGFLKREKVKRERRGMPMEQRQKIETWAEKISLARRGNYFKLRLARRLAELSLIVLSHRERLTPDAMRERLRQGALPISREIQAYLQVGLDMDVTDPLRGGVSRLRWTHKTSPLHLNPKSVIGFLEDLIRGALRRSGSPYEP